ncbi:NAD(P)/FAD-dependent oxidoreductase [Kutzneria chonburiensis]|uniref:NAD(P)/FAD-dependent oxidoreductase n=1 Tax=Kutzneria chonburiensis TaxID=1483604 RepID=A0ABV6MZ46_9PSEU|nr:FAD-dependent oxidoreductase [Kutzneria chonburiensis]
MSVVVVGAGIAGLACARVLVDAGIDVRVLERTPVVGGRLATRRYDGRPADIGAAYFTVSDPSFDAVVQGWRRAGLAREWTDTLVAFQDGRREPRPGPMRWAAPQGLRSLAESLADGLTVKLQHAVASVEPGPLVDGVPVDAAVLAAPGPQALAVLDPCLRAARAAADGQDWQPAFAVTLRYPARTWPDFRGAFVNGHDVLTSICDDGHRRGDRAPVLVAHTTAAYTASRLGAHDQVIAEVEDAVEAVLGLTARPVTGYAHQWLHASPGSPSTEPYHLDDDNIGLCGDAWGPPRVQTAWLSGTGLGRALVSRLG